MVTTRGTDSDGDRGKRPLAELDRNRRPSRHERRKIYSKGFGDEDELDNSEDPSEEDGADDSSDDDWLCRIGRKSTRPAQRHGGSKAPGKSAQQASLRRSSRLSAPVSAAPPLSGNQRGSGGGGRAGSHRGDSRRASGSEQRLQASSGSEDDGSSEEQDCVDSPQAGRMTRSRERQQRQGVSSGGAKTHLTMQLQLQKDVEKRPSGRAADGSNSRRGSGAADPADEAGGNRRKARHGGNDDGDGGGGLDQKQVAARQSAGQLAASNAGGAGGPHVANGGASGFVMAASGGAGSHRDDPQQAASDGDDDGEDEDEDDEVAEIHDDEEEDGGGVRKGRYLLRGQQVNPRSANPAKRTRFSEEPAGEGANKRRSRGGEDEEVDEEVEEGEEEEEDGDGEEEEEEEEDTRRDGDADKRGRVRPMQRSQGKSKEGEPVRYKLRDRSRMVPMSVQEQQRQLEELKKENQARKRLGDRGRSHGGGGKHGGGSRRGSGWGGRHDDSDDDVPDVDDNGHPWRALHQAAMTPLVPWQSGQVTQAPPNTPVAGLGPAHGGAQVIPTSAGHHATGYGAHVAAGGGAGGSGGEPLAPWEQTLLADTLAFAAGASGKEKAGNAEINPVAVDPSVGFDQVGGLDSYIDALKEMVFLPLVYPELFTRFHVQPPRGVLFYGPPGTGKTLVARALAAHASRYGGRKVSFYMRKGADVLSKWVGEAERQLRLLFEEAQRNAPSIIFFDEIDGLAPVRSSRQDQIHNSIVSTLLALMDGLDSRGQVVVIGATNRPDALDGALRRPGRFDRELLFPLPGLQARRSILEIHTRKWSDRPGPQLLDELASLCVGYCGADLKAVCAEAALHAVRRRYPQIYSCEDKLLVNPAHVTVERQDFLAAIAAITPASGRSAAAHARPLSGAAARVLAPRLTTILGRLKRIYPPAAQCLAACAAREGAGAGTTAHAAAATPPILPPGRAGPSSRADPGGLLPHQQQQQLIARLPTRDGASAMAAFLSRLPSYLLSRPRLLVCGVAGCGQAQLAASLLYALEGLPMHALGLPSLLANPGARSPEEALVWAFVEARRAAPAILFLPHLQLWWRTAAPQLRATLVMLLRDLPPDVPLLLLATADVPYDHLDGELHRSVFYVTEDVVALVPPDELQRREVLQETILAAAEPVDPAVLAAAAGPEGSAAGMGSTSGADGAAGAEPLPKDPSVAAAREAEERAAKELAARRAYEEDQSALRALRIALRGVTLSLLNDRRWKMFWAPVDPADDPEYWQVVSCPMDVATLLARVDGRQYNTLGQYLADLALIAQGAREYFGEDVQAARNVSRAAALVDEAEHLVKTRVSLDLAKRCEDIMRRGGPAPPPPGMALPEEEAAAKVKAAAAARTAAAAAGAGGANGGGGSGHGIVTRQRGGGHGDVTMVDDPEALLRRMARLQQQQQQQQQQQGKQEQQQQQQPGEVVTAAVAGRSRSQAGTPVAEGDVEMQDGPVGDGKETSSPPEAVVEKQADAGSLPEVEDPAPGAGNGGEAEPSGSLPAGPSGSHAEKAAPADAATGIAPAPSSSVLRVLLANAAAEARARLTESVSGQISSGGAARSGPGGAAGEGGDAVRRAAATDTAGSRDEEQEQEAREQQGMEEPTKGTACDPVVLEQARLLLQKLVAATDGWSLEALEMLYTRAAAVVLEHACTIDRALVVEALSAVLTGALAGGKGSGKQ